MSGNVQRVEYQEGEADFMAHEYEYDRMNRLEEVFTTTDNVHRSREAHYRYYDYGPLARVEIGEKEQALLAKTKEQQTLVRQF